MLRQLLRQRSLWRAKTAPLSLNSYADRTHTCGKLSAADEGSSVRLSGWLQHNRSNRFLVLRDSHGTVQVLVDGELRKTLKSVPLESVLSVEGLVRRRPEADVNADMGTGAVEVQASAVSVVNACREGGLPFEPWKDAAEEGRFGDSKTWESVRQRYRYLDLRSPRLLNNLRFRANLIADMREWLRKEHGFLEVETPLLFRSTPGGAAEFAVPSRSRGKFFSLPQSPQQFKQLLMVAGVDRYFQVAKCFRDERGQSSRQAEFTQLDLELSFADENSVMGLVEELIKSTWPSAECGSLPDGEFQRIPYKKAVATYGSDKPDLRIPWEICDWDQSLEIATAKCFVVPKANAYITDLTDLGAELASQLQWFPKFRQKVMLMMVKEVGLDFIVVDGTSIPVDASQVLEPGEIEISASKTVQLKIGDLLVFCNGPKEARESCCLTLGVARTLVAARLEREGRAVRDPSEFRFAWVTDFPLFERDEAGRLQSAHHPFTAPLGGPDALDDPDAATAAAFDLVLNGVELGGGSRRIHDAALQRRVLEDVLGLGTAELAHLLEALDCGAPPHAGFALGLDRFLATLRGEPNIRELIAFPKTKLGEDRMSGAPASLPDHILSKYHIQISEDEASSSP